MKEMIEMVVRDAIEELNSQFDDAIEYDKAVRLIGKDASIDSMSFVTLISIIEELIDDRLGKDIEIVSDKAFSQKSSPFQTIETLEDYLLELIEE